MINRVDNRSMMQCLLKCNELLKQVRFLPLPGDTVAVMHCVCSAALLSRTAPLCPL